jgi:1-acyl-sn-glycerol-3-phosphate acyltransferase
MQTNSVSILKGCQNGIMKRLRSVGKWIYGCYAWLVFGVLLLAAGILAALLRRPSRTRAVVRVAARMLLRLAGVPITVRGLERLPAGPHILLANHTSFVDPIVLSACLPTRPGYAFVVRQQHPGQALLWPLLKPLGTVVLGPSAAGSPSSNIGLLANAIRRGDNLIVFPEGGFTPAAGLRHFHTGAFVVAASEDVPVVVAGLRGTRQALQPGTWLPRRVPIALDIGEIFAPEGEDPQSLAQLCKAAYDAMLPLTGEGKSEHDQSIL